MLYPELCTAVKVKVSTSPLSGLGSGDDGRTSLPAPAEALKLEERKIPHTPVSSISC